MKKVVWKNKSNGQLCVTIPSGSDIREGDIVELKRTSIKKIAYSGVVADLFHYGHLHSIQFAKSISDYNICGIITDKAVEEYRYKPISNLQERKAVVSSLTCVDRVMIQDDRDPTENLKRIHTEFPNAEIILVHGSDLKYVHGSEYIKSIGGEVIQHPYYERLSNLKVINKIIENKDKLKDIINFSDIIGGADFDNKVMIYNKADTLKALEPILKKSKIEKMHIFSVSDWKSNKINILKEISDKFKSKIIVRSSAVKEDTTDKSMAGCFESVLDVDPKNPEPAIKKVINSYKQKNSESSFNNILVQNQTTDVKLSGVIFTRAIETNAPYYVINYDESGSTDSVTKGLDTKSIKIARYITKNNVDNVPNPFKKLIESVKEIENTIQYDGLDIEFAIKKNDDIVIFQVRPITNLKEVEDNKINEKISILKSEFKDKQSIYADMPDWNPAEIIGNNPNNLAYSLYSNIITDNIWHKARKDQGYSNLDSTKLVTLFGNKPYVDVKKSFNSFLPSELPLEIKNKLINHYLKKLENNPELQDKVEFEIVHSCYDINFEERKKELEKTLTSEEIARLKLELIKLTNNLVKIDNIENDSKTHIELQKTRENIIKNDYSVKNLLNSAKTLLDNCKTHGTLPFSRLARLAFIGKIILKSMIGKAIDQKFYDSFMNSIRTIASEINEDSNRLNEESFLKKYGHLRPGTYDITSSTYRNNTELINKTKESSSKETFKIEKEILDNITKELKKHDLNFNSEQLLNFTRKALEAREFSKFEFTKNLSDAIEFISLAGNGMGFSKEELSYLTVDELFLDMSQESLAKFWKEKITERNIIRDINNKIQLPSIIFSEDDFDIIKSYTPKPNFITSKNITTEVVDIKRSTELKDKIVMIESGDPGYDWIFTKNPAGLITKYGGVASHMAIRCAEFGIPAAIGCGELYDKLEGTVMLDCSNKVIKKC